MERRSELPKIESGTVEPSAEQTARRNPNAALHEILRKMQDFVPRVDLLEFVKRFKRGEAMPHKLEGKRLGKEEMLKVEKNALSALFIEEIWQNISTWIKEHPPGLGRVAYGKSGRFLKQVSEDEIRERLQIAATPKDVMDVFKWFMDDVFDQHISEWREFREKSLREDLGPDEETAYDKAFRRFKHVLKEQRLAVGKPILEEPGMIIRGGFDTVQRVAEGVVEIVPTVYYREHGRPITQAELREIVRGSEAFVLLLASLQLPFFQAFLGNAGPEFREGKEGDEPDPLFDPAKFAILEKGQTKRLAVKPEVFKKLEKDKRRVIKKIFKEGRLVRTGCPALIARGPDGKNVVAEVYRWFLDLADKYYFPDIDRYNEGVIKRNKYLNPA